MCSPMFPMFVFYYFDNVTDCVGESDVVMVTTVVASPSWTWRSSGIIWFDLLLKIYKKIRVDCFLAE